MGIRSIPPRTIMRDIYPVNGGSSRGPKKDKGFSGHVYKKPSKNGRKRPSLETHAKKEVDLDIFEEPDGKVKVIGEFPGVREEDLIVQLENSSLRIVSDPGAGRGYQASCRLSHCFDITFKYKEVRNGIMTLVLEKAEYQEVPELEEIFHQCLGKFPELVPRKIRLKVVKSRRNGRPDSLDAAKAKVNGSDAVLIFVPEALWGHWGAFRPIIYHELSHFIDLENPDKIFFKRADKKSIELWEKLQGAGVLECKVDKK